MVRQKSSVFQDPTEEINELTGQIKEDISNINLQLDNLQAYAVSRRPSFMGSNGGKHNSQSANHSEMVVGQMKSTLMRTTKGFKDILQVRNHAIRSTPRTEEFHLMCIIGSTGKYAITTHETGEIWSILCEVR